MREKAKRGERTCALTADISEAHRQISIHRRVASTWLPSSFRRSDLHQQGRHFRRGFSILPVVGSVRPRTTHEKVLLGTCCSHSEGAEHPSDERASAPTRQMQYLNYSSVDEIAHETSPKFGNPRKVGRNASHRRSSWKFHCNSLPRVPRRSITGLATRGHFTA